MVLKRPYIDSSSHRATKTSFTVAVLRLLSRDATRPTLERICLKQELSNFHTHTDAMKYSLAHGSIHGHIRILAMRKKSKFETHSRIAVRYRAAGATSEDFGGGPAVDILSASLDSAAWFSSDSLRVEYASHLSRKSCMLAI